MEELLDCEQMRLRRFFQPVRWGGAHEGEVPAHPYVVTEARGKVMDINGNSIGEWSWSLNGGEFGS